MSLGRLILGDQTGLRSLGTGKPRSFGELWLIRAVGCALGVGYTRGVQRIGGGILRGRKLRPLPAGISGVRPTGARVREAVFDHLVNCQPGGVVEGRRVLDICAGSGALMIEALSRGAIWGTALEQQPRVAKHLKSQLLQLGLGPRTGVVVGDARKFLSQPGKRPNAGPFGLVLLDPPYATPDPQTRVFEDRLSSEILERLAAGGWLASDAVIVREYACFRGKPPELALPPSLTLLRTRKYGTTVVDILGLDNVEPG